MSLKATFLKAAVEVHVCFSGDFVFQKTSLSRRSVLALLYFFISSVFEVLSRDPIDSLQSLSCKSNHVVFEFMHLIILD